MSGELQIFVGGANGSPRRLVQSFFRGAEIHRDTLDTDNAWARECFAKATEARMPSSRVMSAEEMAEWNPSNGGPAMQEAWPVIADKLIELAIEKDKEAAEREVATGIDHGWMTCADFMAQDVRQTWLCDGVVPEAQGGIISGRFKTLKTSIACDLFWSMATGTSFLDHFAVPTPVPCALMTSESGPASIMGIMRRIAAAKGGDYRDGPHLTTHRAKMTDPRHLEILERDIERNGWKCVGIDPTYLAFAEVGEFCTNVYKMGGALEPLTALIQRTGCSIILLNHSTKIRGKDVKRYDPPDLAEISMSGWAEWMRFWLLLSQAEEWDEPTGSHFLWLKVGGSVGHGSLHTLTVTEGEHDAKGRRTKWEPCLLDVAAAGESKKQGADMRKVEAQERKEREHLHKLVDAMKVCPDFESVRKLRELSGLTPANIATAIRTLLKRGEIEQFTIEKRGQSCDGYRLKEKVVKAVQGGTEGGTKPPSDCGGLVGPM